MSSVVGGLGWWPLEVDVGGGLETYRRTRMAMPGWADRVLSIAVIPDDDQETIRTKRLMAGVLWVSLPITVLSAMQLAVVFEACRWIDSRFGVCDRGHFAVCDVALAVYLSQHCASPGR